MFCNVYQQRYFKSVKKRVTEVSYKGMGQNEIMKDYFPSRRRVLEKLTVRPAQFPAFVEPEGSINCSEGPPMSQSRAI
jgi:hypothetical protein